MQREELKKTAPQGIKGFLMVVGIVFGILGLIFVVGFVQFALHVSFIQYFLIAFVCWLAYYIIRYYITEYIYALADASVVLGRKIGRREKALFEAEYSDIKAVGRYSSLKESAYGRKKRTLTFNKISDKTACLITEKEYVLFDPTDSFISDLKERIRNYGNADK